MAYSNSWTNSTPANPCVVTVAPTAGDILLAWAITDSTTPGNLNSDPSGFSNLAPAVNSTYDSATFRASIKVADGTETSVSFNSTSGVECIAGVIAFSGRDTTTPLDVAAVTIALSTASTTADLSITPITDGCDLCYILGNDGGTSDTTFTYTTQSGTTGAWTTQPDQHIGYYNIAAGRSVQTTAGAITARCTTSQTGGRLGVLVALRPAASAAKSDPPALFNPFFNRLLPMLVQ